MDEGLSQNYHTLSKSYRVPWKSLQTKQLDQVRVQASGVNLKDVVFRTKAGFEYDAPKDGLL